MFSNINEISPKNSGKLSDYTFSIKDAIWVKDIECCASSDILRNFKPVENATVVQRVLDNGGKILGKAVQDEFGFGSFNMNVGSTFNIPKNPLDVNRATGGSSGGCACAANLIDNHISIAESTGGSIVTPASFCGVVGLCPTYGRVSRYGLISYASSLDKIGIMSKNIFESALTLELISGDDIKDETCSKKPKENYSDFTNIVKPKKVGILNFSDIDKEVKAEFLEKIEQLKKTGISFEEVDMPYTQKYALSSYYIIATSEASTNLACLCGLRYGNNLELSDNYDEYFKKVRTKFFTKEAKRRILLGTFARMSSQRDDYYIKALKIREKVISEYKKIFENFDCLVSPTTPKKALLFTEIEKLTPLENYALDFLTVGPNLAGLPHVSVPILKNKELPSGFMIIGNHFEEKKIIDFAKIVEDLK